MSFPKRWHKAQEPQLLTAPSFASLAPEYQKLWDTMVVNPAKAPLIRNDVSRIALSKAAYLQVRIVPWGVVGLIDQMEAGGGAKFHLHNGDPLKARTVNVPAGRPPLPLKPPFTWLQSANDALVMQGLNKVDPWTIARLCYELEGYNGFGYRNKGIYSPYLWSYSNHYVRGKYVSDGKYNPSAVSEQVGAMPLLKMLMATYPDANFLVSVEPITPPPTPPPITPTPSPAPTPQPIPQPEPNQPVAKPPSFLEALLELLNRLFGKK